MATPASHNERPRTGGIGILLRVFWMLIGPAAMALAGLHILFYSPARFALADAVFLGVAAALPPARRLDIVRYGGTTAEGQPATLQAWRRYAITVVGVAVAAYIAAHGVGLLLAN